ncbi:MAG: hypothetical protein HKN32_02540 [Flavobacteriales bacterium]|nr:hypothetical protein [Flavobacteriales bacterium]
MSAKHKFFIIGDMLELGNESSQAHQEIADLATSLGLTGILVGPEFSQVSTDILQLADAEATRNHLISNSLKDHMILIKGSRGIKLENVVDAL